MLLVWSGKGGGKPQFYAMRFKAGCCTERQDKLLHMGGKP